jgi:hypothetical protein
LQSGGVVTIFGPRIQKIAGASDMGKLLITVGGVVVLVGVLVLLAGRFNLPLGRLPGDFTYRGKNTVIYFPLATSLLLSLVISAILYLISRFR